MLRLYSSKAPCQHAAYTMPFTNSSCSTGYKCAANWGFTATVHHDKLNICHSCKSQSRTSEREYHRWAQCSTPTFDSDHFSLPWCLLESNHDLSRSVHSFWRWDWRCCLCSEMTTYVNNAYNIAATCRAVTVSIHIPSAYQTGKLSNNTVVHQIFK